MTLLEKYFYDNVDFNFPKEADDIMDLVKPILKWELVFRLEELITSVAIESALIGFKQGYNLAKEISGEAGALA